MSELVPVHLESNRDVENWGPYWTRKTRGVSHAELTLTTYRTMQRIMRDRGLRFSDAHWAAIFALCRTLTEVAQGKRQGRIVWGMPTGCGKTTVVEAFLIALAELHLDHIGVVVCQNRIGALVELRRELRKYRVADDRITLLHSDAQHAEPSDQHDPDAARQFVLMTHAAVVDRGRLHAYREWHSRQRVVIWDEALFTRQPASIDIAALGAQLGGLKAAAVDRAELQEALQYLISNEERALAAVRELKVSEAQTGPVAFARCDDLEAFDRMSAALSRVPRATDAAEALLRISQLDGARVRTAELSGGVISYRQSIPRDLGSIIVLDASWACRDLLHNDRTLTSAEDLPAVRYLLEQYGLASLADLKSYQNVHVSQILAPGGRYSVVGTKNSTKQGDLQRAKPVLLEVIADAVVKAFEAGMAGLLVYHFKAREGDPNPVDMLEAALEARRPGITTQLTDPGRVSKTSDGRQPAWLKFERNGDETGFNHARHCEFVILWGVLHDADHVITSKLAAVEDDLDTDLSFKRVTHYRNTEKHHRVLQAISRGAMRNPGESPSDAAPMKALVVDPDETLGKAMEASLPGIQWNYRPGPKGYSKRRGLTFLAKRALSRFLQQPGRDQVSTRAAKAAVEAQVGEKLSNTTWKRLRDEGAAEVGWTVVGAQIQRKGPQS